MKKILLTGFRPFKKEEINPSEIIAKNIHGGNIGGKKVISQVLPTTEECGKIMEREIESIDPGYILSLGLAAGRNQIMPERVAVNVTPEKEDEKIFENGADAYFSLLPLNTIIKELHKNKIPARISNSAGTYFCNYIMYYTLHHVRNRGSVKAGFIHIPYVPEQVLDRDKPSMSLKMIERAIEIVIRSL
ncbi:MAG: pyroglutamyl-peptidase I [Euryarchaeota archaeon]|nr:pyroglutamyl-peptidase I [Euryarchaeota archaeon]